MISKNTNPKIKLRNGFITFAKMSQTNIDTGYRNTGSKLSFRAKFQVEDNKDTVKEIAEYYNTCNGKTLNAVFKDLLKEVKDLYSDSKLFVSVPVSDMFNLGITNPANAKPCIYSNFTMDGNWHSILTEVVNRHLERKQKDMKFPFIFKVTLEEVDDYSVLPKITISHFEIVMRQKADKKSLAVLDGSANRFEVMQDHISNNIVKRDQNGNTLFPRKTKEGFVEYGKDYEIFPSISDGAIFDVLCSLYFNKNSKTMTVFPAWVAILENEVVSYEDPFDISDLGFAAPVEAKETKPEDVKEKEEIDYDDECPF